MSKWNVDSVEQMSRVQATAYAKRILRTAAIALVASASGVTCAQPVEVPASQSAAPVSLQARIAEVVAKTRKNLVFVQGGSFEMGDFGVKYGEEKQPYSSNTDDDYLHKVTLSSFSISAYKVTYAEYDVFSDATGRPKITTHPRQLSTRLPDAPAGVDWQQAHDYCQWIGKQLGVPMSLPTEAQWEYAARDRGKLVIYATDNGKIEEGRNVASYDQAEAYGEQHDDGHSAPMPVGLYPPTELGLYDVVADAFEWTADWYSDAAYKHAARRDPKGPALGRERVLRGCSNVESLADVCMTFARFHREPQIPKTDERVEQGWNPNRGSAVRCVANTPDPVPKE